MSALTGSREAGTSPLVPAIEEADGKLTVTFPEAARSWSGMHGGVVVGTLLRAAARATGRRPAAVTAHLHRAVDPGSAGIVVTERLSGRTVSSVSVGLDQGERRASASVVLSGADDHEASFWRSARQGLSSLPAPQEIERLGGFEDVTPMAGHLDIRPLGDSRPFGGGDEPVLTAWVRLRPAPDYQPAVAAVLLDALVPSMYAVLSTPTVIPTVEFTVHYSPVHPSEEWFFIQQRTTWSTASLCVDEAELRTPEGTLVAQSRQLRRVLGATSRPHRTDVQLTGSETP
jgi:acyl-CoA thioesterase